MIPAPTMRQRLETALAVLEREGHGPVVQVLRQLLEAHTVETWNAALAASSTWIRENAPSAHAFEACAMAGATGLLLGAGLESALARTYQGQVPAPRADG